MTRLILSALTGFLVIQSAWVHAQQVADERPSKTGSHWTSLFNGKSLEGWDVKCLPKDYDKRGY